jgi:hypothetical protein
METSLAKPKVSSRGKPPIQRPRPPMEFIEEKKYEDGEDGVASLGFDSVIHLAH